MKSTTSLPHRELPSPPRLRKLLGPSFILLGLGLGSGEVILWPNMTSLWGLGIAWGILVGISLQFIINMEVARYALINGESIFVGFQRLWKPLPIWFIISTFLGFGWPGIGLYGATLFSQTSVFSNTFSHSTVGIFVFLLIGIILSMGRVLYVTVEKIQMVMIGISVPIIFALTVYLSDPTDYVALIRGLAGFGEVNNVPYNFLPPGIIIATFLGALAYAGAGGNLNLAQSFYIRDKGFGMGAYADRIKSLITTRGAVSPFKLSGATFPVTAENLKIFKVWWRTINIEHFLIFWGLGLFTMLLLSLLAYTTTFGVSGKTTGTNFIYFEAMVIGMRTLPIFGEIFLFITGLMLCATQLTVLDSTSRIITENILLLKPITNTFPVSRIYYIVLWMQIGFGIMVFSLGFDQPLNLIILGAVINGFSMFIYTGLLLIVNNKLLEKPLRPSLWRKIAIIIAFLFFGYFGILTIFDQITKSGMQ